MKSRGHFVPVLPNTARNIPYFALGDGEFEGDSGAIDTASPVFSQIPSTSDCYHDNDVATGTQMPRKRKKSAASYSSSSYSSLSFSNSSTPKHLEEHSYAKTVTFERELQQVEVELAPENLVEGSFDFELLDPSVEFGGSKRFCQEGGEWRGREEVRGGNFTADRRNNHQVRFMSPP